MNDKKIKCRKIRNASHVDRWLVMVVMTYPDGSIRWIVEQYRFRTFELALKAIRQRLKTTL
jgi:hypothetical protein